MNRQRNTLYRPIRFAIFLAGNLAIAIYMLVSVVLIRNGQEEFKAHAKIDREYVDTVIGSGEAERVNKALKITEVARAYAYKDYVSLMTVLQFGAGAVAVLFFLNTFFLFRLRQPLKALGGGA